MKISSYLVALALTSALVIILSTFYASVASEYGVTYDTSSNSTIANMDKFDSIKNISVDMENQLFNSTKDASVTDLLGQFLGSGFNILKLSAQGFSAIGDIIYEVGTIAPGTTAILSIIAFIAVILFLFAVVAALVGRDI